MYVPLDSWFISIQFFVLNLDGWFGALSSKSVIFDILLLYYYGNLNSSIICCLFFEICIFLLVLLFHYWHHHFVSALSAAPLNSLEDFDALVILSAIFLPIKSPVVSAVLWLALFEAVSIASAVDFLKLSRSFWPIYGSNLYPCF